MIPMQEELMWLAVYPGFLLGLAGIIYMLLSEGRR